MTLRMNSIWKACISALSSRTETAITRKEARAPAIQAIAFIGLGTGCMNRNRSKGRRGERRKVAQRRANRQSAWALVQVSRLRSRGRVIMESAVWTAMMPASRRASPPNCRARM